jgi:hypothetical protein
VDTFLGLAGFVIFIVAVIAFAAAMTWIVVKVSPSPERRKTEQT